MPREWPDAPALPNRATPDRDSGKLLGHFKPKQSKLALMGFYPRLIAECPFGAEAPVGDLGHGLYRPPAVQHHPGARSATPPHLRRGVPVRALRRIHKARCMLHPGKKPRTANTAVRATCCHPEPRLRPCRLSEETGRTECGLAQSAGDLSRVPAFPDNRRRPTAWLPDSRAC